MGDATGVAEVMLGLPGFQVLEAVEAGAELVLTVETVPTAIVCPGCGGAAVSHDRAPVEYRDLPCFGRPVRLVWRKRRHRCPHGHCDLGTWTETRDELATRCLLTRRAAVECCVQVGVNARPVSQMARELGVAWHTVMDAVAEIGEPLVDDPRRVGDVSMLGIDETTWLSATRQHRTRYATSLVDLAARVVIDVIPGNASADVQGWLEAQPAAWCHRVAVVATDLAESYRHALGERLAHAIRVADPFHVVRVGNRCLDQVRRRVQNTTLGHRGRKADPLYRARKLMVKGAERLDEPGLDRMLLQLRIGDPEDEVLGAWLAKESVRDIYLTDNPADAEILIDKAIQGCRTDVVPEIRSLGRTLARWRTEILAHHLTGASNGPTEALNLLIKKVKRAGHGFRNFHNYRLRILLHAGGVAWTSLKPPTPSLRAHRPR
ncbi:MAG: ISL3 family transposase [Propionibacteriaceae bacterium]|nr:ISL3 family transposase [Propionibacteriaceae bacterium]